MTHSDKPQKGASPQRELPGTGRIRFCRCLRRLRELIGGGGAFGDVCRMIRVQHSVFALPFAYAGAFLACGGWPGFWKLFALTLAMVFIRSFAMTVNRIADLPFDSKNPRTADRPLVTGAISERYAWRFSACMAVLFVLSCAALNTACLLLSPLALILSFAYSYTKRLTSFCHFVLGLVLALAPVAGWLSVSPAFALPPFLLAFAVLFWVAGFDIIYACLDVAFDTREGLHSMPVRLGIPGALLLAKFCHVATVLLLFLTGLACGLSFGWYLALAIIAILFLWEHRLVRPDSLENIGQVFSLNAPVSVTLFLGTLLGVYL
jgi:putative 4-hydroxybenzoate polyprenyltransferase